MGKKTGKGSVKSICLRHCTLASSSQLVCFIFDMFDVHLTVMYMESLAYFNSVLIVFYSY